MRLFPIVHQQTCLFRMSNKLFARLAEKVRKRGLNMDDVACKQHA